jgi:hypothetical protein
MFDNKFASGGCRTYSRTLTAEIDVNIVGMAALTAGVAVVVPGSTPNAFDHSLTSAPLKRPARRSRACRCGGSVSINDNNKGSIGGQRDPSRGNSAHAADVEYLIKRLDEEHDMKRAMVIGLTLASALAIPALAQQTDAPVVTRHVHHHIHHVYHHLYGAPETAIAPNATAQVAPFGPPAIPFVAPYPKGVGDEDGLSRNVDDCNKGCIGGNPG